jgi:hypothetical protein
MAYFCRATATKTLQGEQDQDLLEELIVDAISANVF